MKTVLYIDGKAVSDFASHPVMRPAVNALKAAYDLASDPQPKSKTAPVDRNRKRSHRRKDQPLSQDLKIAG